MRKSQDIIGLPVIQVKTGERLGVVRDLLFDEQQQLRGVLLENGGWMRRSSFIPSDKIASFGEDAVIVDSEEAILPLDEKQQRWTGLLSGQRKLKGRQVMMANGQELGFVEDVYFKEELGTLVGYELSDGFLADIRDGRKILQPMTQLTWGEDVLIAPTIGISIQDAR